MCGIIAHHAFYPDSNNIHRCPCGASYTLNSNGNVKEFWGEYRCPKDMISVHSMWYAAYRESMPFDEFVGKLGL